MAAAGDGFTFPDIFHFPPFFTLQSADLTRAKQLEQWRQFVLSWHQWHKATVLIVKEWPYWQNSVIKRGFL